MSKIYSRLIRPLMCCWCLLAAISKVSLACENIEFVGGRDANLTNFDTFSNSPSKLTHALQFKTKGDCQSLEIIVGQNDSKNTQFPLVYILAGRQEVYNSAATPSNREKVVVGNLQNPINVGVTIYVESSRVLSPSSMQKKINLSLLSTDSQGETFRFEESLDINLFVKGSLSAGLSGANLSRFSQHYDLDLGTLKQGKSDKTLDFHVQSNQKYELRIRSKNKGKLLLVSSKANVQRSTLSYRLIVDGKMYNLVNEFMLLENATRASKIEANQHSLQLVLESDPKKARAGRYKDTLVIEITHGS